MKLNFQHQLWTANDVYNSTVACDFLLVCFPPALLLCIENYSAMKKSNYETVSFNWNAETYLSFFYDFLYLFLQGCWIFSTNFVAFKRLLYQLCRSCHFNMPSHINNFFEFAIPIIPSFIYHFVLSSSWCEHHLHSTPPCHCTFYTNLCGQTLCLFIWKKRERSFWIGNSLSHLQCCCLMQLLLLGWKTSWMVNEYNMQIVVEWQMVLWCKK